MLATPAQAAPLRSHGGPMIGTAVDTNALANEAMYRTVLNREFNIVTAENAMKWDATEPNAPGQFTFGGADTIVSTARANGQQIHGHTLVWHSQTPGWVQSLNATDMRAAMQRHINALLTRYGSDVRSWDVVNEAFNEDGTMRNSFWLQRLGSGYIADAFRLARAADPDAELCINDFNTEGQNAKSNGLFNLVQSLLQQGVPINCVGFQGHLAIQFGFPSNVQANFQRFANLGLNVKITELDVRMQTPRDANKDTQQATFYRNMVNACVAVSRCNQITMWGFTDLHSWVPGTFPNEGFALPLDNNYQPKPAYTAIDQALPPGGGGDTTPPTTPGTPTASNVTSTGASLAWAASTDAGGSGLAGYDIVRRQGTTDTVLSTSTTNSATLTNLTANTQYVLLIRARDGAGNQSALSGSVTFTTQAGGGDTTPPTTPGTPTASNVTSTGASLAWAASTDAGGSGLAGYDIVRRQGTTDTVLSTSTTNSATLTNLTPATQYVLLIRARDGAGNQSALSASVTFTTQSGTGGTCRVAYSASNWGTGSNGFTANVVITNTGTAAINGWTLAFAFPSGQQITPPGWSATWAQSGANMTATNLDWNRTLNAGTGTTTIGFNGTFTGTNTAPTGFTLNGTACTA
ncbi:endo-1,4-beta-xylanase [Actinophytocola sp.]|uniref:endo-1,4-beta-xylanase n=1 Tax=Actinophytocola sp. TaxID=1872138 RepID=UPI002E19C387